MMNFPFGTNRKFIILGVPILKHIRVLIKVGYSLQICVLLMSFDIPAAWDSCIFYMKAYVFQNIPTLGHN